MNNSQPDFGQIERSIAPGQECAIEKCDSLVYRVLDKHVAITLRYLCADHILDMAVIKERRAVRRG